jgi:hypothetical protein
MVCLILGIILAFASIWIGFYLVDKVPWWSWAKFPAVVTVMAFFVAGAGLAYYGVTQLDVVAHAR